MKKIFQTKNGGITNS